MGVAKGAGAPVIVIVVVVVIVRIVRHVSVVSARVGEAIAVTTVAVTTVAVTTVAAMTAAVTTVVIKTSRHPMISTRKMKWRFGRSRGSKSFLGSWISRAK